MKPRGFTLAELLIALAILGVIATFTIPKVLTTQQDTKFKSIAKEAASTITGAYDAYRAKNAITANTGSGDLTPFMNYVAVDTVSSFDDTPPGGAVPCSNGNIGCLRLHNGAILEWGRNHRLDGTTPLNAFYFYLDPDGQVTPGGTGNSITFFLYTDGKLRTWGTLEDNTAYNINGSSVVRNADPSMDPAWFSWN